MQDRTYNLRELCREAGVTERTVRYYIKEGLLPPPNGSGSFSRYGYEHWLRLQFIKRLKDEYLPLSEIKNLLDSRSTGELDQLARQAGLISSGGNTAKGQSSAVAQVSDPLPDLIGGGGTGRARMLREQMAPMVWSAPPGVSDSFAAPPQSTDESYESAPALDMATFAAAPAADIDAFADLPEAASLSFPLDAEKAEAGLPEEAHQDDEALEESIMPPPRYGAPAQAFSAQSFMSGGSGAPGATPMTPGAAPLGGVNHSTPAPLRAMKMSRFAANEAASDIAPVGKPAATMPKMARMASSLPSQPPENADETVTGQTWERIEVAPGVELHIEKRIADTHRPALANLLHSARRLFGPKEI